LWPAGLQPRLESDYDPLLGRHNRAADLGVADPSTTEVRAAMDWLAAGQERVEGTLAGAHVN